MHSQRFKDPLLSQARAVTYMCPLIEETLRSSRIQPNRENIIDRFVTGQPRIAVVRGSEDHPYSVGCRDIVRRLVRQVWTEGALPIEVSQAVPCEELSLTLPGSHYAFLGRNVCAANFGTLMEAHGYDAAMVIGACDKMLAGVLRALVEADLARQNRKARPVYALFIPPNVSSEVYLDEEQRRRFDYLRDKLTNAECRKLFDLLDRPITSELYGKMKACLDRAFRKRLIPEIDKDELERVLAKLALAPGALCASSEASIVNRLMVATFGLVPRQMDLCRTPPQDKQLSYAVRRLLQGIHKRERRISISQLVKSNLQNGLTVWSATGGHPSWLLHLNYLADALGVRLSPALLQRKMSKVPRLFSFDDGNGLPAHGVAVETESGKNSGIDTLMRTLSEKRLIDDRAATLEGSWMHRITEARSANGRYFHSTITPCAPSCGLARVHGNFSSGALVQFGQKHDFAGYDKKIYLADFYLGLEEFREAMAEPNGALERIRRKVTREGLYKTSAINWGTALNGSAIGNGNLERWSKQKLWNYLLDRNLLRCLLFVAGEGPRASGMPQVSLPEAIDDSVIRENCVIATDGRVAFGSDTMSIVHIVPEAIDGGGLAGIRTGDWVYLNMRKGEFQIVTSARNAAGFRVVSAREIARRSDVNRRVHELERRRQAFLPSIRSMLDSVSSAAEGVSPLTS